MIHRDRIVEQVFKIKFKINNLEIMKGMIRKLYHTAVVSETVVRVALVVRVSPPSGMWHEIRMPKISKYHFP